MPVGISTSKNLICWILLLVVSFATFSCGFLPNTQGRSSLQEPIGADSRPANADPGADPRSGAVDSRPPGTDPRSGAGPRPANTDRSPAASDRSILLSWTGSPGAIGYKVYRAKKQRGPYELLTPVLVAATMYEDFVKRGGKYFYVVTAVDGIGQESAFSEEVGPLQA